MSSTTLWSRKFLSFSLLLILLTGAGLGLLAKEVVHSHLSQLATSLNEDTARVLRNTLWADFSGMLKVDDTGSQAASMAMEDFLSLRDKLAKTMTGSEIVKVKVYNRQGLCVFSTDPRQIGELKASNPGVVAALAGEVSSGLTHRGEFDAMHAQLTHVDIFHSYVPIKVGQDIVGVFEVYQNVSRIKMLADRFLGKILVVLFAVLAMLFMLQYLAMRRLGGRLQAHEEALGARNSQLASALDDARRADRTKSEFISTVSHELRTPLTAINGALGLMSGGAFGELPGAVRNMVAIAHKNGQRLGHLINDLLDMEKLMAGKLHFELKVLPVMPLVEQAIEANLSYADQYGVRFELRQRVDDAVVEVDPQRLQQVLSNLLSNAAKFSPSGAAVLLDVIACEGRVRMEIRDHGPGIPMAFRGRIFQKFSQADGSDVRQKGGTGLGLAISKELVERLGGRIGFESVEGQGTCFFIELPRCSATLPVWPDSVASDARPRILAVDDDVDMARMLAQMLERAGYAVDCATSGAKALTLLAERGYAAMTLDLQLPDMTGQALIERLRADPATAGLPVLVLCARMEEGQAALTERMAGVEFIAKPIDQPGLLASLSRVLAPTDHAHPRVLHVEDDAGLHRVVRAMAGDRFDFELATTLREARARVALERFDVVILDLTLPNETGWDLLPQLQAQQPGTRVVVLTGTEMSELDSHRVDAVLRKGHVTPQELLDAINGPTFSDSRNTL